MASNEPTVIDGNMKEGGGQILRIASALSCILCQPITVNNIRAKRSNPGLRPQHMTGLQLIRDLCNGRLQGDSVGSTEITLTPSKIQSNRFIADTKTAGNICLMLQISLPCTIFGPGVCVVEYRGGTNTDMAPPIDHYTMVFQPIAEKFGLKYTCDIKKRGYYPKGGGEVVVTTTPVKQLQPIQLTEFGRVARIVGRAFVAGVLPIKIARQMASFALTILKKQYRDIPVNIEAVQEPKHEAFGNGTGIIVVAETSTGCLLAGSALGKKGVPAQQVGQDAADMLIRNLQYGGCVDEYLQDQLIIFMALANGKSQVLSGPITLHTETAITVAEMLTQARFTITPVTGTDKNMIECHGIGLTNQLI
ncbi:RNA 3'-terminal phosphate cyclase-like isoform X2 [Ptychodera flava]|uniref:RNA 3'-terminal phosphate cyclase-like isoform X2 n=1 Tax=Ptychodera flava TaxID=63121 RepID=UPI00396A4721